MEETDRMNLDEECQRIIENVPIGISNDKKMRYVCHELGMLLSKSVEFFYERENTERRYDIYNNYKNIENYEVVCRNAAYKHVEVANKLGLDCKMIEMAKEEGQDVAHWSIEYNGDNNKRYIINPIPDFYRIQMGFSTRSFCSVREYPNYDGEPFDTMSKDYLREMDEELGYLSGGMYTEELLKKFHSEINCKLGAHIVKGTNIYQNYYFSLIKLMKNNNLTTEEKLDQMKSVDPDFEKHKTALKECLETNTISKEIRKIMHNLSFKSLIEKETNLEINHEGSLYTGELDVTQLKSLNKEILIYKYNYMLECFPQLTNNLTGFIENKNFFDEVKKYLFKKGGEREAIHRHTVSKIENGKKEYYMMFSLKLDEDSNNKIYSFYNQKTKQCVRNIEPLDFMIEHGLTPRKDSSLNDELEKRASLTEMLHEAGTKEISESKEKLTSI